MPPQTTKPDYRISKTHGRVMMLVALVLDFIPLAVFVLVFSLPTTAGALAGAMIGAHGEAEAARACNRDASGYNWLGSILTSGSCAGNQGLAAAAPTTGAIVGGVVNLFFSGTMLLLAQLMQFIASCMVVIFGFLLFTAWFTMKGVYVLAVTRKAMLNNFFVFMVKMTPVLNALIPAITFATWRHIRLSQTEDEATYQKVEKKLTQHMTRQQHVLAGQSVANA